MRARQTNRVQRLQHCAVTGSSGARLFLGRRPLLCAMSPKGGPTRCAVVRGIPLMREGHWKEGNRFKVQ